MIFDVVEIAFGACGKRRWVRRLRTHLMTEQLVCLLARAADLLVYPRRPSLHLLVHPVTAAFAIDDADAFADGVEDQVGLLGDESAFERQEVGGVGKDRGVMIVSQRLD